MNKLRPLLLHYAQQRIHHYRQQLASDMPFAQILEQAQQHSELPVLNYVLKHPPTSPA